MTTPFYRSGDDVPQREIQTMLGREMTGSTIDHYPQTATANHVIQIGSFTKSTLNGLTKFCQLFEYEETIDRSINPHAVGQIFPSGSIAASHVKICIPTGNYVADLQTQLYKGNEIKEIIIRQLASIKNTNTVIMEIKYSICYIAAFKPQGNRSWFTFRFDKRDQTFTAYDQTGKKQGKSASQIDLTTSKVGGKK
ncbi:MAG: hypothetical protein ACRCYZ_02540 [Alphaproteobacteria bacterium]